MVRRCWSREAAAAAGRRTTAARTAAAAAVWSGGNGSAPGLETPVDIAPYNARRHEHSAVEGDPSGTSVHDRDGRDPRDLEGKPARHRHLDFGMAPGADYSSLATGGTGGAMEGGRPGKNGAYEVYRRRAC